MDYCYKERMWNYLKLQWNNSVSVSLPNVMHFLQIVTFKKGKVLKQINDGFIAEAEI